MILSLDIFRFTDDESRKVSPDTINLRDNVAGGILLDFSVILSVSETVGLERRRHFFFRFILEELSGDAKNLIASVVIHKILGALKRSFSMKGVKVTLAPCIHKFH
jgi:hypothetical protein